MNRSDLIRRCSTGFKELAMGLVVLALSTVTKAEAFQNFPFTGSDGQTQYLKWGDNHAGTPGGILRWSLIPAGTPGSASYCGDACPGVSVATIPVFNPATNQFDATPLVNLVPQINRAMAAWSGAARVEFAGPDGDTGTPINAANAAPPNTGVIRIGAFQFTGNAAFVGAVGYAAPPNGGTGSGDVLFNANAFFQIATGSEGDTINFYPPGGGPFMNEVESLFVHELGHALGMAHPVPDGPPNATCAVMSVNVDCYSKINRALDPDDIVGIRFLYGTTALPTLSITDVRSAEGNAGVRDVSFKVNLSAASSDTVTVKFRTVDGTATAGSDYTALSTSVKLKPGQTSKAVKISVNGDTTVEPDETLFGELSKPVNATITDGQGVLTIRNDD